MPWLIILLVCILRWMYAPDQMRYLYASMFCFGICMTIHQTLVCAAIGIELAVIMAKPKLGRDLLFCNSLVYVLGLAIRSSGKVPILQADMIFAMYNAVGMLSIAGFVWLTIKTGKLLTEWKSSLILGALFILGVSFYFYEPIAGMTDPPMQWGYPRTVEGFYHALSRGQYEKITPTEIFKEPRKFMDQMDLMREGITSQFNWVFSLFALLPFLFIFKMQRRERSWIIGLSGVYFCISVILMILLNPNMDRSSTDLVHVFFTSSHAVVGIMVGYGMALTAAFMACNYQRFRIWGLAGGAIACVLALFTLREKTAELFFGINGNPLMTLKDLFACIVQAFAPNQYGLPVFANLILVAMALAFIVALAFYRNRAPLLITLGLFAGMPLYPALSHWWNSEQRGHMYGYWFGHDMFTPPPFNGADGKPLYPEMTKDAVLFGGTDPGRFCPTYMIFCESFTPHDCQPAEDQKYDRRDVYIITQNALADHTYLSYIRAHYNRSAQIDPPFFQEFFHSKLLSPLDTAFTKLGAHIEKRRRTYTSWFQPDHIKDLPALTAKLKPSAAQDPLSKWLYENLSKDTQTLLAGSSSPEKVRAALVEDLNTILDRELQVRERMRDLMEEKNAIDLRAAAGSSASYRTRQEEINKELDSFSQVQPLYTREHFKNVKISHYLAKFIEENPQSHTRVRMNRLLLEEAYPNEIAKSLGGVYPDREILTPTEMDSKQCFDTYLEDAARRMKNNQLKQGEEVHQEGDHISVAGQTSVMAINGLLTKVIFDKNPENEFYVEESFALDWMYPYLTPFSVIMKINRQPMADLTEDVLARDHEFWKQYSKRMTGDIIDYDTKVEDVAKWIEKTYLRHNLEGFTGDRKFLRDKDAPKAFSKLRSSIAGIYAWRLNMQTPAEYRPKTEAQTQRLYKEANFALLQAFAICPYSPEAVYRYINLLLQPPPPMLPRFDDALIVAKTCQKLDPNNGSYSGLIDNLETWKKQQTEAEQTRTSAIPQMEVEHAKNPANFQLAFNLAEAYRQTQKNDNACAIIDSIVTNYSAEIPAFELAATMYTRIPGGLQHIEGQAKNSPPSPAFQVVLAEVFQQLNRPDQALQNVDALASNPSTTVPVLTMAASIAAKMGAIAKVETILDRATRLNPDQPESWFDLAGVRSSMNKLPEAIAALSSCLDANARRLQLMPAATDLASNIQSDPRLASLRLTPEYRQLMDKTKKR